MKARTLLDLLLVVIALVLVGISIVRPDIVVHVLERGLD